MRQPSFWPFHANLLAVLDPVALTTMLLTQGGPMVIRVALGESERDLWCREASALLLTQLAVLASQIDSGLV